jgi:single-strand DNA-binding protein
MISYNSCVFIGNAGRAPEIRATADGTGVASFSLAVSTWNREEEGKGEPIWLRIVAFGKLAETVEKIVKKGSLILVAGRLSLRDYTTKDGKEKTAIEIIAQTIQHLEKKQQESEVNVDEVDRHMQEANAGAQPDMAQAA